MSLYAVILCGGRGERFWPKSRQANPKQFIPLFGTRSLTQETSSRVRPLCPLERQLFVAPAGFGSILRKQLGRTARLVFEPRGRNTAPAIGLAAAYLRRRDPDAVMVVLPADHLIENRAGFLKAVRLGARLAQDGLLVTFGISPDRADTGYGYVQLGEKFGGSGALTAHQVKAFKEKPGPARARAYVAAGNYAWNSGMFVWRVDAILAAFRTFMPNFHASLDRFAAAIGTGQESRALERLYRGAPAISVDYAVMEKAANVACVRGRFDWDDVGSWLALSRHIKLDPAGNAAAGLLVARDSDGCVVDSDSGVVAALGVRNLVIVRAGDAVLVAGKQHLGKMKQLLAEFALRPATRKYL